MQVAPAVTMESPQTVRPSFMDVQVIRDTVPEEPGFIKVQVTRHPASEDVTPKFLQDECAVCEYSTGGDCGLLDMGHGMPICPYCAIAMKPDAPLPSPTVPESDLHLLGAWRDFSDKLISYHSCLASIRYHEAKVRFDAQIEDVLHAWGRGDLSAGAIDAHAKGESYPLYESLWPFLHYGRVLQRIATAYGLAEVLQHSSDVDEIKRAIAHPEVRELFNLFLSACANRTRPKGQQAGWKHWGESDAVYSLK